MKKFLENRFFILYLAPLILGSLSVLSFQPFNFTIINFFILPLLFYLIVYIKKKSKSTYRKKPFKKNLFIFGTFFGFSFYLSGIHWITQSLTFDENFKILIPIALFFIPLFLSLFFSLTILLTGPFLNYNFSSILFLSSNLAISDYIRAKILTGFPWNLWVYSFSWATEIIQILNKIGLFAFNLISITIFMLPAVFFFHKSFRIKILVIFSILLIFFTLYIYGSQTINKNKSNLNLYEQKFKIKIISPNFDLKYGLFIEEIEERMKKLIRYSEPKNENKILFIWPEGVFSGYSFNEILDLKKMFQDNFSKNHLILFGVNKLDQKEGKFYNTLVIVNNHLEIIKEYNKQKLVPFGEFLPYEKTLNKFGLKKITEGYGSFLRGKKQENIIINNLNILPLICYEIIFPSFIQRSSKDTNLIINISEDGWFGDSIGPYQHFVKAIFRAIESNTFVLRSANKGISAIINNKGEVVKKLNINEAGNIYYEVPLVKSENKNKNDLIFFILLFTYIFIFYFTKKKNGE